jgi:triacylglycerol esterase/lipase EstA (alpha/beta hydrolase family)
MMIKFTGKILTLSLMIFVFLLLQTASVWSATVSGNVKIEGKKDKSGVLITIQGLSLSGITNRDGNYSIKNIPSGSYTITAQKPGNLTAILSDVKVESETVVVDLELIPGDLKIDNQINLLDRIVLTSVWKSKVGDANWNSMMDIYEDSVIDEKDRDLLLANWRKEIPNVRLGTLSIEQTNPPGATILINGADTGKKTPYTFLGMIVGEYDITLELSDYTPKEEKVKITENQVAGVTIESRIFDNQPPEFANWVTNPVELTEDNKGSLKVTVQITDKSGLSDKIPQFDYHIGSNTSYSGYKPMKFVGNDLWSFEIPEPVETWDTYRGKYIYYKANAEDAIGNSGPSQEQQKLIISINDPPIVKIVNSFTQWQKGLLTITADASDTDGTISKVRFEYSFDNANWIQIGQDVTKTPYSVSWDTKTLVAGVMKNVWLRTTATDNENAPVTFVIPSSFGIDNQTPTTSHDYNGLWHNADFPIVLKATDGSGIGVSTISYKLNNGNKQDIEIDGQSSVSVIISKEDQSNVLEYWSTDKLGNEEQHKTLSNIELDKTSPAFSNWQQNPVDLTEDTKGSFRIYVQATDNGSGLTNKVPQIDYHIGTATQYDGYEIMVSDDGKVWYFDIMEPTETWDAYRGKYLYYKVKCEDVAGNVGESPERAEMIDSINDPPVVKIISVFNPWNKGVLKIDGTASDQDGTIAEVSFAYSLDKTDWKPIGASITTPPYTIGWDTATAIQQTPIVWLRVLATDNEGASSSDTYPTSFGIDNQPPITNDNYNDLWHKENIDIILTADDGNGIGVFDKDIRYNLNNGEERNVQSNGQPKITDEGTHQLEYWGIDKIGNTEVHHIIQNVKLDKTPPSFSDWIKDPSDLTEKSVGPFRISVRVTDNAGSGLAGSIPQINYHIGKETYYGEYINMRSDASKDVWYYDIVEPANGWNAYRGKTIYYNVKAEDVAGNQSESSEQQELIDDINDPPTVKILTVFNQWEKGSVKIEAEASDIDGTISNVEFDYSTNKVDWNRIDSITTFPYSITWDTKESIPKVALTIWVKAISIDDDGVPSKEYTIPKSFQIDNEPPTTNNNYDNTWKNKDFNINLTSTDYSGINGIGVQSISYILNNSNEQTVPTDGQTAVLVRITKEGINTLEYWSVDELGNEEKPAILTDIKLDKTAPSFANWEQTPADVTEKTKGSMRVSVKITDSVSGLTGKIAQFNYHIGTETNENYKNMTSLDGTTWYFEIPEPLETWNYYRGKYIYYKVKIEDVAGNITESDEQRELIDSINDPPIVKLLTTFKDWETKDVEISVEASDPDGSVPTVQFEYSLDNTNWAPIGEPDDTIPYSITWNTANDLPELAKSVWVRAIATDADDNSVTVKSEKSRKFGIDNQSPIAGNWTKIPNNLTEDTTVPFRVTVDYDDNGGSGVSKVEIAYKIGTGNYGSFRSMIHESNNTWYYEIEILETGGWDKYRGQILYYKARATDAVGNVSSETKEQQELIDDINDPPSGSIVSISDDWKRGSFVIQAIATDQDGEVSSVQFQYSTDNVKWIDIVSPVTKVLSTYSATWNSTVIEVEPEVWLRATITDDDKATAMAVISKPFGIDNKSAVLANWKLTPANLTENSTEPFLRIAVDVTDDGSGVADLQIKYSIGQVGNLDSLNYQTMINESGTNTWWKEIQPVGKWSSYPGQKVFYKVKATDKVGNIIESEVFSELIDPTTGVITGKVAPRGIWQVAKVSVLKNNIQVIPDVSVSQIDGSYTIAGMGPGLYDIQITAPGYGTDKSNTNIEISVGLVKTIPDVELYTYTVENIIASQGGEVKFKDADLKNYSILIDSNALLQNSKVVLGFSDSVPLSVLNPTVNLLGKAIGVGYQGKDISKPLRLILPRPSGITDSKSILAFVYNGIDYRLVDKNDILANDSTITVNIKPDDVRNFSDQNHKFDRVLSKISDTVFYVLITKFNEPQIVTSDIGIRDPQIASGRITNYAQPNILASSRKIALVIHGITSKSDNLVGLISDLRAIRTTNDKIYYDHVLAFNYESGSKTIAANGSALMLELARILPSGFGGKIDVIAHGIGGLVTRYAITNLGMDQHIGSLIMLATPNDGVSLALLKAGFGNFLKKSQSDPAWSYYRDGWQGILEGSQFLASLNGQPGKNVNTHYYAMAASNSVAPSDTENEDGLVYIKSVDFTGITFLEQALTERFEKVNITEPSDGLGFMSNTRHVAILTSSDVRNRIITYLRGKSENIVVDGYDIDLTPGNAIPQYEVVLKNTGTEAMYGVTAQLSTKDNTTPNNYISIVNNSASYGNIVQGQTVTKSFSLNVSSNAISAMGQSVTFMLVIRNAKDNSIAIREFQAPIGGNLIRIALNPQTQAKLVVVDAKKTTTGPQSVNDNDAALEPGEVLNINITLENRSASAMQTVKAVLKTADPRVKGLLDTAEVDMSTTGLTIDYATLAGLASVAKNFQFVKLNNDNTLLGSQIIFTLDIKSGTNIIGTDTFTVDTGASIVVDKFEPDTQLVPGGLPQNINVTVKNVTSQNIQDITITITPDMNEVDIPNDESQIDLLGSLNTEEVSFLTSVEAGFTGYVVFTIKISVGNKEINVETRNYYFGMRTHYVADWIADDNTTNNNRIAEPGEHIELRIPRRNPINEIAQDVEADIELTTPNPSITLRTTRINGDYSDVPAVGVVEAARRDYEFDVVPDVTAATPSGSVLSGNRLTASPATPWVLDAFVGRYLNPNTTTADPQYWLQIIGNGADWIEVASSINLLDPDDNSATHNPVDGNPFQVRALVGIPVNFTLKVSENGQLIGEEAYTTRIGGYVRYLTPDGYSGLLTTISDAVALNTTKNNGNGIPEPGETIELTVTLIHTSTTNVSNVLATLDTAENDVTVLNNYDDFNYGSTSAWGSSKKKAGKFRFTIDQDIAVDKVLFELSITGDISGLNSDDLGIDTFVIPIKR